MKLALNLSIFLLTLLISGDELLSLTDYQIKRFCKKEKRQLTCIKNLRKKRLDLEKGNLIEIPVIHFKN